MWGGCTSLPKTVMDEGTQPASVGVSSWRLWQKKNKMKASRAERAQVGTQQASITIASFRRANEITALHPLTKLRSAGWSTSRGGRRVGAGLGAVARPRAWCSLELFQRWPRAPTSQRQLRSARGLRCRPPQGCEPPAGRQQGGRRAAGTMGRRERWPPGTGATHRSLGDTRRPGVPERQAHLLTPWARRPPASAPGASASPAWRRPRAPPPPPLPPAGAGGRAQTPSVPL